MSRPNGDDVRARKAKADADAFALLSSPQNRGRVQALPVGTLIRDRYRIERYIRGTEYRNLYVVSLSGTGELPCWECGLERNPPGSPQCTQCEAPLMGRELILAERWRANVNLHLEMQEMGIFHPSLACPYELIEENQRLFSVSELMEGRFLADLSSPFSLEEVLDLGIKGCELLAYLHKSGLGLSAFGRDYLALQNGNLIFHDLELDTLYPDGVPQGQRLFDLERFRKLLREYVPHEAPEVRSLLMHESWGRIDTAGELARQLQGLKPPSTSVTQGHKHTAAMSDVGMHRTLNEDSWGWARLSDDVSLYVVADGMGGHDSGEVASELAVTTLLESARKRVSGSKNFTNDALEGILEESFQDANNHVKSTSEQRRSDMGTTLVGIMVVKNRLAFIANVGDSRAYLLRDSLLKQCSLDHSLVASLVSLGKLTRAAARNHPHSNILIRTVGKDWDVEIDIFRQELLPGDTFLLCSDGLWGEVEDTEIRQMLVGNPEPRVTCQRLVQAANQHGGHDNVTAMMVQIGEPY